METAIDLIGDLGLQIASGLIMAYFIFLIMKKLMDGLVSEIKTVQSRPCRACTANRLPHPASRR